VQFVIRTSTLVIPMYPPKLEAIISLFESLPEVERRETLVSYADNAKKQEPRPGETFALEDVRKDEECADTVGVYLQVDDDGKAHFRMTLGLEVQTLTHCRRGIGARAQPNDLLRANADQRRLQSIPRPPAHGGRGVTGRSKTIDCFTEETDDTSCGRLSAPSLNLEAARCLVRRKVQPDEGPPKNYACHPSKKRPARRA
jgi:cysteine desulfuration protein SufE